MDTYVLNFYPIAKFIIVLFALFGLYSLTITFLNNFSVAYIIKSMVNKFPDVLPEFMRKPLREQNIENNQEIHDMNKRLQTIEDKLNGK